MDTSYDSHRDDLEKKGFTIIKSYFTPEQVELCKKDISRAFEGGKFPHHITSSTTSYHVHNFFLYGDNLREMLFGKKMQEIHKNFLSVSYTLRNAVASSIQVNNSIKDNLIHSPIGSAWHRDTPQFYDRNNRSYTLNHGITFQIIIALDPTNSKNATKALSTSHLDKFSEHKLDDEQLSYFLSKYDEDDIILEPGDIAIIDDNIFHKAGVPDVSSRWLLFCSFTPWYIKPYFDYSNVLLDNISDYERHCLHQTSTPPDYNDHLRNTYLPNNWDQAE